MKSTTKIGILAAVLVAFITTILIVFVVFDDPDQPLDTRYREKAFRLLEASIDFTAPTCFACLLPTTSPGLVMDCDLYRDIITNSTALQPQPKIEPSKIQLFVEQSQAADFPDVTQPSWLMVNLEFLQKQLAQTKPKINIALAKTLKQVELLKEYRRRNDLAFGILYTRHTSHDIYNPTYEKDYNRFVHVAGQSPFKNTRPVVEAWLQHPEWPRLTVVTRRKDYGDLAEKSKAADNIQFQTDFVPDEELSMIQNSHGIHVCPSSSEGFGHYINEARATKALVIGSNASPMNELVFENENGILIGRQGGTMGNAGAPIAKVTIQDVEGGMKRILALSIEERKAMGERSRELYIAQKNEFHHVWSLVNSSICNSQNASSLELLKPHLY